MKSNRNRSKEPKETVRFWTYDEVRKASPYIASVLRSIREHQLEGKAHDRRAHGLATRLGRPTRSEMIAHTEEVRRAAEARELLGEAVEELHSLDVFCTDPVRGEAVIPFVHEEKAAWFAYDLFAEETPVSWRYHDDPMETHRPIAEALEVDGATV